MTLGCARMWVAHTEFYATGQNVWRNHEWPDKCFVRSVNVRCPAVISHTAVVALHEAMTSLEWILGVQFPDKRCSFRVTEQASGTSIRGSASVAAISAYVWSEAIISRYFARALIYGYCHL